MAIRSTVRICLLATAFALFGGFPSLALAQEEVVIIGSVKSSGLEYTKREKNRGGFYSGFITLSVWKVVSGPDYVVRTWIKEQKDGRTAVIQYLEPEKPGRLEEKGGLLFTLYPLEHNQFWCVGSKNTRQTKLGTRKVWLQSMLGRYF